MKSKSKKSKYIKGLLYHRYRFGLQGNFKVWLCRRFGHQVNKDPSNHCCERCGLAYEEIYHNIGKGWWQESGIVRKENTLYEDKIDFTVDILSEMVRKGPENTPKSSETFIREVFLNDGKKAGVFIKVKKC